MEPPSISQLDILFEQCLWLFVESPTEAIVPFLIVAVLLVCSALISGSEVAYFGLSPNQVNRLKKEQAESRAATRVLSLLKQPGYLLATILIANNFINIGIILLSKVGFDAIMPPEGLVYVFELPILGNLDIDWSWFISVIVVTFVLVLFGEVSPKIYAKLNNVRLAKFMSRVLIFLKKIFYPLSGLLVRGSGRIERRLSAKVKGASAQDITHAIELTMSQEEGTEKEADILQNILKFNQTIVKQIMKSRVDVKMLDFDVDYTEMMECIKDWNHSRIPVYDEDFDNILGILHIKDMLPHMSEDEGFEWQALIQWQVMYVPEIQKINGLLTEFKERRVHMAIVVDEYGGSSGIVTLEDVLEEVVGDINEENDSFRDSMNYTKENEFTYVFEGKTMLNDIGRLLDVDMEIFDDIRGESDTVAGLLLEFFGFLPSKGRKVIYKGYTFEVKSSTKRRITEVRMVLPQTKKSGFR